MDVQDLIITPVYIILLTVVAYLIRPIFTTSDTRKYFLPALWVKFLGALAVGFIYQFYYSGGGDTFMYYRLGTTWVWEAFLDHPLIALKIIFGPMEYFGEGYFYQSQIYTFGDAPSFFVVRIGGIFSILTANTYSAIAVWFAFVSFLGIWQLFVAFNYKYPQLTKQLAIGILFLPSVFFWGSGLLKDTITLGALGFLFHALFELIENKRRVLLNLFVVLITVYFIQLVKIYIILAFLPAVLLWVYLKFYRLIKNIALKLLVAPSLFVALIFFGTMAAQSFAADSHRYNFERVLITAEETARWNYYESVRQGGSGYTFGDYDFSSTGMLAKFFPAVLTSFYRPFLFEVRNPVMLMSAIENGVILILSLLVFFNRKWWHPLSKDPLIILCISYSMLFGFSVGVTTYNFGSLVRYKIPMLPFLLTAFIVLYYQQNSAIKRPFHESNHY